MPRIDGCAIRARQAIGGLGRCVLLTVVELRTPTSLRFSILKPRSAAATVAGEGGAMGTAFDVKELPLLRGRFKVTSPVFDRSTPFPFQNSGAGAQRHCAAGVIWWPNRVR